MTTATIPLRPSKPLAIGLLLGFLGILYGFGFGVAFGLNEANIKARLAADGEASLASAYAGDQAKMEATVSKAWSYYKRAHLHAGAIGTSAVAASLALILLCSPSGLAATASISFGLGSILYPIFWWLAGSSAPSLGGTGAAKESLALLGQAGSAACMLGLLLTIFLVARATLFRSA